MTYSGRECGDFTHDVVPDPRRVVQKHRRDDQAHGLTRRPPIVVLSNRRNTRVSVTFLPLIAYSSRRARWFRSGRSTRIRSRCAVVLLARWLGRWRSWDLREPVAAADAEARVEAFPRDAKRRPPARAVQHQLDALVFGLERPCGSGRRAWQKLCGLMVSHLRTGSTRSPATTRGYVV